MRTNAAVALLLEDEPLISMDLEQTLAGAGFNVTTVMSCTEAEDWLAMCRPDLVIVDLTLRDGPSDHIVERLAESKIPFIIHSGDHPDQHLGTPFTHGRRVSKPASADELIDAARAVLVA
jgi:DNA-binding response OmpR family regulator